MMKKYIFLILFLPLFYLSYSQSNHSAELIERLKRETEQINKKLNQRFINIRSADNEEVSIDRITGRKRKYEENGIFYEAVDIQEDGLVVYYRTRNLGSGKTINTYSLNTGELGFSLNGKDFSLGVWDASSPELNHPDFDNNIIPMNSTSSPNPHSTHVVGTIKGLGNGNIVFNGQSYNSKGVANQSTLLTYDWKNDWIEMAEFAHNGGLISNHSYGPEANNDLMWMFGAYTKDSYRLDEICFNNPYYQPVVAAGNDNGLGFNPAKNGYDLLLTTAIAKNTVIVAASYEFDYQSSSEVKLASFSSTGPTDDGRIKPDITAKGAYVYSAYKSGYQFLSGTSMAAPAISSGLLLLQEYYHQKTYKFLKSSTLRGLLLHSAREAGISPGPDYKFGWGLADFKKAVQLIESKSTNSSIEELTLKNNELYTKTIRTQAAIPLKISISWTDSPGNIVNGTTDSRIPVLVNDLDIKVIDSKGVVHYPWKLNPLSPGNPATNQSENNVDNFERIDIDLPDDGDYKIQISHKGTLKGNSQDYSLIISGQNLKTIEEGSNNIKNEIKIYPNPIVDQLYIVTADKGGDYKIFDYTGRLMKVGKLKTGYNQIDMTSLKGGIYIIRFNDGKTVVKKGIIVL